MMTKRVLDVGSCPPDHAAIRHLIEDKFDAVVMHAHDAADAIATLEQQPFDLVLVNRKLDHDYSDGLLVIERIKGMPALAEVPVMLITNYEDHQQQAIRTGAERGFGKLSMEEAETLERLGRFLS
jgi:CheY-like chemotaxis protein